jgi:acyl-CoA thioesterase FadM
MEMAVFSSNAGAVAATGEAMIVAYDYGTKAKTALPADVVARIRALS